MTSCLETCQNLFSILMTMANNCLQREAIFFHRLHHHPDGTPTERPKAVKNRQRYRLRLK
eukprot:m.486567 g.486567  ORF g.486567 m.486567 type:complete len:60 (+) comp57215_c0_seq16:2866-3045(+)